MRPTSTANGDGTTAAAQADSTSPVRPSSTANGNTTGAAQADSALGVQPSSAANDEANTGASRTDNPSRVQSSSAVGGCGTVGSVCVGLVDEVGLPDEGLRSRLKVLG
ncbi:MAG: hypothetical protein KTV16_15775, partial [Acidimicrobiia bacterium]|nr:hypothetical protein [Acidimicrobiia bacterium]